MVIATEEFTSLNKVVEYTNAMLRNGWQLLDPMIVLSKEGYQTLYIRSYYRIENNI